LALALCGAGGCMATHDESLGERMLDAASAMETDASAPVLDAGPEEPSVSDAGAPPVASEIDAGLIEHDAGHDAGTHDAGAHDAGHDASDAARDADHDACREPWEPWECR
jgi:hypothetical protein